MFERTSELQATHKSHLLALFLGHGCLHHTDPCTNDEGQVADIETKDAARVLLHQDVLQLQHCCDRRQLTIGKILQIHNDHNILHLAWNHHVPEEIFHAEDEQAAELITGHARWTATRSHDQGRAQAGISATEVEESLLQIIQPRHQL